MARGTYHAFLNNIGVSRPFCYCVELDDLFLPSHYEVCELAFAGAV